METTCIESGFLYANPSFTHGFGSVLDFSGSALIYNRSSSPEEADLRAIASDWAIVGSDLEYGIEKHEKEEKVAE